MARIRSTHPGQWTDEDFVSMSYPARLLAIALRNEADDQGVFEWKPVTIKIKLFPADNVDVPALLSELIEARQVTRYEMGGKSYGAIRNFRRWQRPEKPKPAHPLADGLRGYVGLPPDDTAAVADPPSIDPPSVDDQSPTDPRNSPQREEVGGNGEEIVADDVGGRRRSPFDPATLSVIEAAQADPSHQADWMMASSHVAKWLGRGFDLDLDVLPAIRKTMVSRRGQGPPNGPAYFDKAILEAHERRLRPLPTLVNGHGGRTDGRTARQSDHDDRRARQGDALRRLAEGG